jgi:hypothetical protein
VLHECLQPTTVGKEKLMLLILLIVLLLLALGGGGWGYSRYGAAGLGPAGVILVVLLVLWFAGYLT